MTYTNTEVSFYVDCLIVEALLSDESLLKTAQASGVFGQLIEKLTTYFGNHIDPNDKSGTLLRLLAPGAVLVLFSALNMGWLGSLIGLAMNIFHVDVKAILTSIWNQIKSLITGDKPTTSDKIDEIVESAVSSEVKPATEEEAASAANVLNTKSSVQLLRDAKMLKLAMIEYENHKKLNKLARPGFANDFLSMFNSRKSTTVSLLAKVLGWIFKIALASAGLLVAGDVVNKFLGRPNAIDNTVQKGKPIASPAVTPSMPKVVSKQKRFPVNAGYTEENKNVNEHWMESVSNNEVSIDSMLLQFAKDVYSGLNGKESYIRTSPGFGVIRDKIVTYNRSSAGDTMVFIPKYFTSKKQIVDMFIDDVAESAP